MDLTYNSISGINTDPTVYLKEFITKNGKQDNQMTADTRIYMLIVLVVIIVIYGFLFAILGGTGGTGSGSDSTSGVTKNIGLRFFEVLLWSVFIMLVLLNGFQYFFNVNLTTRFINFFTDKPQLEITMQVPQDEPVQEMKIKKEVFNIPNNTYTYDDAKAICTAYGAKLANYDEIESSYQKGGEWCNYGWSDNQMALFPTQKETWDKLQKIKGHENDCGRTGINGGYMANPKLRFGVNCYGNKPKITAEEENLMKTSTPYPETEQDMAFQKRVDFWKNKVSDILVSPFNYNSWGSF